MKPRLSISSHPPSKKTPFSVLAEESNFQPYKPTSPKVSQPGKMQQATSAAVVKKNGRDPASLPPSQYTPPVQPHALLGKAGSSDPEPKSVPSSPCPTLGATCLGGRTPPWTELSVRQEVTVVLNEGSLNSQEIGVCCHQGQAQMPLGVV